MTGKDFEVEYAKLRNIFWGGEVEDNANIILKSTDEKIFANFNELIKCLKLLFV